MNNNGQTGHSRDGILLLAYYYLPATTSGVQRAVRFSKYLPRHGFPVFVVSASESGDGTEVPRVVHVPNADTIRTRASSWGRAAARIQRILPYNEQLPWVPHAVQIAGDLIRAHKITGVVSTSPPLGSHFAAWWLKRKFGLRWIADFRDPVLGNPGRPRRWALAYDKFVERMIFRSSDAILVVTDIIGEQCRRRYPRWADKIHVVWNGFDPEEAFGLTVIPPRPYRSLTHAGVLYGPRQPNGLLASLDRMIQRGRINPTSIRLRFLGPIQDANSLYSNAVVQALLKRGCLEIRGETMPRQDALHEIATSDYLLLLDIADLSQSGYAVPAKLHDYARTGRPILAVTPEGSPVERILSKSGLRYTCLHPGDTDEAIDAKLLAFLDFPPDSLPLSAWYLENFDGSFHAAALASLIDNLRLQKKN